MATGKRKPTVVEEEFQNAIKKVSDEIAEANEKLRLLSNSFVDLVSVSLKMTQEKIGKKMEEGGRALKKKARMKGPANKK